MSLDPALVADALSLPVDAFRSLIADVPQGIAEQLLLAAYARRPERYRRHEEAWLARCDDAALGSLRGRCRRGEIAEGLAALDAIAERERADRVRAQLDRIEEQRRAHPTRDGEHDPEALRLRLTSPRDVALALGLKRGEGGRWPCPVHGGISLGIFIGRLGILQAKCFGCDFHGDVFALIAAVRGLTLPRDFRAVLREAAVL